MRRPFVRIAVVLAASLVFLLPLAAQERSSTGAGGDDSTVAIKFPEKPTALVLQDLKVFKREPKSLWFFTSNPEVQLGEIPKDGKVKIEETKYVDTLFEKSVWLKVSFLPAEQNSNPLTGWVYAGKSEGDRFVMPVLEKP